jgi:rhodanese-related sulfurtransferase
MKRKSLLGSLLVGGVLISFFIIPTKKVLLSLLISFIGDKIPPWDGGRTAVIFLDARERAEYDVSHLPNAHWIGSSDFDVHRMVTINKSDTVVLYCSVGYRSQQVGRELVDSGYTEVYNLKGGIFKWLSDGHTVVDEMGNQTQDLHPYNEFWGLFAPVGEW